MCSIIGSLYTEKIRELSSLNAHRGQHSHSLYVFDVVGDNVNNTVLYSHRGMGPFNMDDHPKLPAGYIVVHQQAPTTDSKDESSIHPAQIGNQLLWHNGIIKADEVKRLQELHKSENNWDTYLMLQGLVNDDVSSLESIDGTFSCFWYDGANCFLFRNEISPMFIDEYGNISSTKFDGSASIDPNFVWLFYPGLTNINNLEDFVGTFITVENPYFFMDEQK
jgi:asparagine synthetase B (glutamine-hydrolysing)